MSGRVTQRIEFEPHRQSYRMHHNTSHSFCNSNGCDRSLFNTRLGSNDKRGLSPLFSKFISLAIALIASLTLMSAPQLKMIDAKAQSNTFKSFAQTPRLKPPAPGPQYLSFADYRELKAIKDHTSKRRWSSARAAYKRIEDPEAKSLGQWYYFDARDPNVDLLDGITFLDSHPQWPSTSRIQRHLESRLSQTTSSNTIYALFDKRDPITGNGKIHFISH